MQLHNVVKVKTKLLLCRK